MGKFPKRDLFTEAVIKWKDRLWANDWLIDLYDAPDKLRAQEVPDGPVKGRGATPLAEIHPKLAYLSAALYYDGPAMDDMSDKDIDTAALHEVCHLVAQPLVSLLADVINDVVPRGADEVYARWLREANERVATHIERIARKGVKKWVEE